MSSRPPGIALVIAAPSGAGKTTLARALVDRHDDVEFSVSATTRPKRKHEKGSRDYHFVEEAEFLRMQENDELLEWATVHGRRYGTPRGEVEQRLKDGRVVILDIDVKGASQVRQALPQAVLVFVLPPSAEELRRRLATRDTENHDERQVRLQAARQELRTAGLFDYIIVNDDFEAALKRLEAIVTAERAKVSRSANLEQRIDALDRELEKLLERNS
ncbi:MAG TPA: guanylate kinase [Longimicrobiales bacterium]